MRVAALILALAALVETACSDDSAIIGNATALRGFLLNGRNPVSLEPLTAQRGCGPSGCSIDIGGLSILREQGMLQDVSSKMTLQIQAQTAGDLPELDWEPLGSFAVSSAGKPWGTCLEFTHIGLGKSGRFQRWGSVMLIPMVQAQPMTIAYRFVGYWVGCDMLSAGEQADEVSLPSIEWSSAVEGQPLQLVWHNCTISGCQVVKDHRTVREVDDSETGALRIGSKQ